MNRKKFSVFDLVNSTIIVLFSLCAFLPIYYVISLSFTDQIEYLKGGLILFPRGFTFENYRYLLSGRMFPRAAGISAYISVVGTLCGLAVTSTLAYTLSRKRMMGRKLLILMILFTTLFNPGMIPPYLLIRKLGLIDNLWALILPAMSSGWYVFLMKSFFESIPESLEEAAIIDGCGDFAIWWRVILPLSLPSLAAFGLFFAVAYWNVFFNALLYINNYKLWPLQMVLRQMLVEAVSSDVMEGENVIINPEVFKMAAVVITITPIMMVYPFLQKHFTKGVMLGSVKG